MPIPTPVSADAQNDENAPTRAAATAGTINSVILPGLTPVIGATRMPTPPATTLATTQLTAAWKSAE